MRQINAVLRDRHHIAPGALDDFHIRDLTEISETFAATSRVMTNLLLVVALISLAVGGVGIMNIMLVSVTERTHEIGIRMAVGARSRDILRQFLAEAVVLCLTGGIAGIVAGRGVSVAVTRFLNWPTMPSVLFNGMISPIIPYGIKGAIWYQGESNASQPKQYQTLFPMMITDWRTRWAQGDFRGQVRAPSTIIALLRRPGMSGNRTLGTRRVPHDGTGYP